MKLIQPRDYEQLAGRVIELKRMLTALFQKLVALGFGISSTLG